MASTIRRAVIARIAKERRVSMAVARTIYYGWPVAKRVALCDREARRRNEQKDRPYEP